MSAQRMLDRKGAIRRNIAMPPCLRLVVILLVWSFSLAQVRAQDVHAADVIQQPSSWMQAFDATPAAWAALAISAILTAALAVQLGFGFGLGGERGMPPKLVETLEHAMEAGNYQEAWETCGRWRSACLARVLEPALERIGHGQERVETALARHMAKERKSAAILTWSLLGTGVGVPLLGLLVSWAGLDFMIHTSRAVAGPRTIALASGDLALIAAAAFAIAAPSLFVWISFRREASRVLAAASEEASRFVKDLAYEDLEGLRIGKEFDAGTLLGGETELPPSGLLRVSRELTTACPACNAPINPSRNPCPHCGTPFEWS